MSEHLASLSADQGVVAPATAVMLAVLVGMVGLVTDASVWYAQRRQLQAATDAAALAAAPYADDAGAARDAANAVLRANGLDPAQAVMRFATGQYCLNEAVNQRFRTAGCSDAIDLGGNAVRIKAGLGSPLFLSRLFSGGANERRISTVSTAARINQAGLQAGTGLATVNAGLANALLSALAGGSVSLTAAQCDGLLKTNVDALSFFDALATRVGVSSGTYGQLLSSSVGVRDVVAAQIAALAAQNQVADVAAAIGGLQALQGQIAGNPRVSLGTLFDLGLWRNQQVGQGVAPTALHAGLNLMQLTSFSLQLANGNNGAAVPTSFIGLPGVAGVRVAATAIEPPVRPYFAFGPKGVSVHTAQVRVQLELNIAGLGIVPLYLEAASGNATLGEISCFGDPTANTQVEVAANSGIANVYIGAPSIDVMRNFSAPVTAASIQPAEIVNLRLSGLLQLVNAKLKAHAAVGAGSADLSFVQPGQSGDGVIGQPALGGQMPLSPIPARVRSNQYTAPLLGRLTESLSVNATLLGVVPITLSLSQLRAITSLLDPVLIGVDGVVDGLLRTLGVQLGYVDVAVTGVRCGQPVLIS